RTPASSQTPTGTVARCRRARRRSDRRRPRQRSRTATIQLAAAPPRTETIGVERQRISSGAAFEERVGYSRAVRVGPHVWVSGTAPILPGDADPPPDAYEQAKICLAIVERALNEAGASLDDVVRTRIYVADAVDIDAVGRAH